MSKKTRKSKKKTALKTSLPKPKAEPTEEKLGIHVEPEDFIETKQIVEKPSLNAQVETVLLTAPRLPWKLDMVYVSNEFRKAYVGLLRNLVELYNLPYTIDQAGTLTPK